MAAKAGWLSLAKGFFLVVGGGVGQADVGHGESSFVQSESLMFDGGEEGSDQKREPGGALARVTVIMLAPQALRNI